MLRQGYGGEGGGWVGVVEKRMTLYVYGSFFQSEIFVRICLSFETT